MEISFDEKAIKDIIKKMRFLCFFVANYKINFNVFLRILKDINEFEFALCYKQEVGERLLWQKQIEYNSEGNVGR